MTGRPRRGPDAMTRSFVLTIAVATALGQSTLAQQVTEPVYRVANQNAAAPAPRVDPAVQPVAGQNGSPFDLVKRQGEHELMPFIRMAKQSLALIDAQIADYTGVMTKSERVDGKLSEQQQIAVKFRHQPFGVYMKFIKPHAGREVLYPSTKDRNKLVALDAGWKRRFGAFHLDPNGSMAMSGQRHPITKSGIRNLTASLLKRAEGETKYAECTVRYSTSAKIDGRATTMVEITHPVPRSSFENHVARVFFDNEYRVPVGYQAFSWPAQPGGQPVLEKQYFYTRLAINAGLTDADFDENNPNLFQ